MCAENVVPTGIRSPDRPARSSVGVAIELSSTKCVTFGRLHGSQGRNGCVRKMSLLSGFDPQTVQPVVSRYTD